MASNTSEGEERMIALLTQLVENNSNDDSDRLAQTANSLSTAAMAVSIVALAIGLLQALLQYASSNENHREKCNIGAIGRAAMLSGTSTWSWRQWRRKYTYPVLDLSHWNVVHCLPGGKHDLNYLPTIFKDAVLPYTPLPKKDDLGPGGALVWWENWSKWDYGETIEYGPWRLYRIGQNVPPKMVSPKDLPLLQQLRWHWHSRLRKRDERLTPRATWAQLLETFGIFDIRPLVLRRMDAECIPSSVDVPTQKIALADLGILAFHLKMTTVAIDVTERTFLATGPCGSISTEDLPSFGKVVRFQSHGDFNPGFRSSLLRQDKKYQLLGDLCFGFATGTISVTTRSLERSRRDWARITERIPYFLALETKGIELSTSAISESESWEKLGSLSSWREEHKLLNVAWPTIFLAATTACLPGETVGFPSQIMLRPFLECLGHWAKGIRDRCGLPVELIRSGRPDSLDSIVLGQLQCQDLCMTDVTHVQEPEAVLDVCELSSWAFWQIDTQTLKEVELSLCRGRGLFADPNEYRGFEYCFPQTDAASGNSQGTYRVLDNTISLLSEYDTDSWTSGLLEDRYSGFLPKKPQNVLWTQVLLLDLTIRELLNSLPPGANSAPPKRKHPSVDFTHDKLWSFKTTCAVVHCWSDSDTEWPLQNLESYLVSEYQDELDDKDRMKKLANLIQLRALFFLAYLMVLPDSSDLYRASRQAEVVLPMI